MEGLSLQDNAKLMNLGMLQGLYSNLYEAFLLILKGIYKGTQEEGISRGAQKLKS